MIRFSNRLKNMVLTKVNYLIISGSKEMQQISECDISLYASPAKQC